MIKNFLLKTVFILLCGFSYSLAYAQCTSAGPLYALNGSNQLQTMNPTTAVVTATSQTLIQGPYTSPYNGANYSGSGAPSSLAFSAATNTLWYIEDGPAHTIYSMKVNSDGTYTRSPNWARFEDASGNGIPFGGVYSSAVNPKDGSVWFILYGTGDAGFYRLDPNNLADGARKVVNTSINGNTDIVFDTMGNLIALSGNTLFMYPARYDANGNYLGVGATGTLFASLPPYSYASLAFLPDGNLMLGGSNYVANGGPGSSTIYNVNTGAQTNMTGIFGQAANNTTDLASCFSGNAPNIKVSKTGTRDCSTRTIQYTITVNNTAAAMVSGAMLKDATPAGLTLVSGTRNGVALTAAQLASLGGTGLPLRTAASNADGIMNGQSACTVVLNYSYPAASAGADFSNQGFVTYSGVETLNLPNDQIPSDDPNTAAVGDPTVVMGCGVIAGTVFTDNNGTTNGPDGTPTSGVTTTLFAADGVTQVATTTTDTNGNYRFTGIVPGNYVVVVTPPTGFENVSSTDSTPTDGRTNVTIPASGTGVGGVNFGIAEPPPFCYKPAVTTGTILDTQHGISSLGRAGGNNSNWPMVRKGAWTVLEAKTKGFVPNRLTTVQKNALTPVEGMMVYDTDLDCLSIYNGTAWNCFKTQACPD